MSESASVFVVLLPLFFVIIDLIGLSCGAVTVQMIARQAATRVASATGFSDGLANMKQESQNLANSGCGQFARLQAVGGLTGSGVDLYFKVTNIYSGKVSTYGPNQSLPPPVDTQANVYECSVKAIYNVGPLLNLSVIPFVGDVPGLGKPATLTSEWDRAVEKPEAFAGAMVVLPSLGKFRSIGIDGKLVGGNGGGGLGNMGGWDYPLKAKFTPEPGQRILAQQQITVDSQYPYWTDTGIDVQDRKRVSFNIFGQGTWKVGGVKINADGIPGVKINGMPKGCLKGKIGAGQEFVVGQDLINYNSADLGRLQMMINDDDYGNNNGVLGVTVILTN